MAKTRKSWTDEDKKKVVARVEGGEPALKVALSLGMKSASGVYEWLKRYGTGAPSKNFGPGSKGVSKVKGKPGRKPAAAAATTATGKDRDLFKRLDKLVEQHRRRQDASAFIRAAQTRELVMQLRPIVDGLDSWAKTTFNRD